MNENNNTNNFKSEKNRSVMSPYLEGLILKKDIVSLRKEYKKLLDVISFNVSLLSNNKPIKNEEIVNYLTLKEDMDLLENLEKRCKKLGIDLF